MTPASSGGIGIQMPESPRSVEKFLCILADEQARFLRAVGQAAVELGGVSDEMRRAAGEHVHLSQRFLDAQRALLRRRADVEATLTLLDGQVDSAAIPPRAPVADPLFEQQRAGLSKLLDEWWAAAIGHGTTEVSHATARTTMASRLAGIDAPDQREQRVVVVAETAQASTGRQWDDEADDRCEVVGGLGGDSAAAAEPESVATAYDATGSLSDATTPTPLPAAVEAGAPADEDVDRPRAMNLVDRSDADDHDHDHDHDYEVGAAALEVPAAGPTTGDDAGGRSANAISESAARRARSALSPFVVTLLESSTQDTLYSTLDGLIESLGPPMTSDDAQPEELANVLTPIRPVPVTPGVDPFEKFWNTTTVAPPRTRRRRSPRWAGVGSVVTVGAGVLGALLR